MELYYNELTNEYDVLPEYQIMVCFETQEDMDEFEEFLRDEWTKRKSLVQVETEKNIMKLAHMTCCPVCDNEKCVRGTDECEAEQWVQKKLAEQKGEK